MKVVPGNVLAKAYKSFGELSDQEIEGQDYAIRTCLRNSPVLVMAPHCGKIEPTTTEIAEAVAGNHHSSYSSKGIKADGNGVLYIRLAPRPSIKIRLTD